jgi:lincosamide nucleotidyltransferase A/C/D/E
VRTRLKRGMRATDVLYVLGALREAGVGTWVTGGWGVDALVGEHTRKHLDLDVIVAEEDLQRAQEVLAGLGFSVRYEQVVTGAGLPKSVTMGNPRGLKVDIHPVDLDAAPFNSHPFSVGNVAGKPIPCLTGELQVAFHRGYEARDADTHDMALLSERLRLGSRQR